MRILVLQHLATEHPGVLRDFMTADGFQWTTIQLDEGGTIPDVDDFDLMMVMGGPQDVWQDDLYPWMKLEKAAIKRFVVTLDRPFLGICLGHQLLADAIGGHVGIAQNPEVGIMTVSKTSAAASDPLLAGVPDSMTVLQWHGAEVSALPPDATILAQSPRCAIQAFRYGQHAYGVQFHIEITGETVGDWAAVPSYLAALEAQLGPGGADALQRDVAAQLASFNRDAKVIYNAFMALARQTA